METGSAIAVDAGGHAYVAGRTNSSDFPVVRPLGPLKGDTDAFIVKLIPTGDALVYSTPLDGSASDEAFAIALDGAGNAYLTGETESSDFQTVNPFQANNLGQAGNAFVARLTDDAPDPAPILRPSSGRIEQDDSAVGLSGTWYTNAGAGHSGGSAAFAETHSSRAVFTFSGTGVRWIGSRDEWSGIARVSLDGVFKGTVDTYASPAESQAVLFAADSLPANEHHTLVVETTGASNASSGGAWVWVDAFEVIP